MKPQTLFAKTSAKNVGATSGNAMFADISKEDKGIEEELQTRTE
jgi:hypothetical protein